MKITKWHLFHFISSKCKCSYPLGLNDTFIDIGEDSLDMAILFTDLEDEYDVDLYDNETCYVNTISDLIDLVYYKLGRGERG